MFTGNPLIVRPSAEFSSRGQFHLLPGRNTSFEICCLDAGGAQRLRYALADVATMAAIGHDRAAEGQLPRPAFDLSRSMMDRTDNQLIIGVEGVLAAGAVVLENVRRSCAT
jgi:hypothetical protein